MRRCDRSHRFGPTPPSAAGSTSHQTLSRRTGRRHRDQSHQRGHTDGYGADDGKGDLPAFRRHRVFHDAMRCVIAGDRCWCDEGDRDEDARPERPNGTEQELADAEGQPGGKGANDKRADPAGAVS